MQDDRARRVVLLLLYLGGHIGPDEGFDHHAEAVDRLMRRRAADQVAALPAPKRIRNWDWTKF